MWREPLNDESRKLRFRCTGSTRSAVCGRLGEFGRGRGDQEVACLICGPAPKWSDATESSRTLSVAWCVNQAGRPRRPAGLGFAPDPCLLACNALRCHALQLEKSHGGSGRKDEDDAAAAARTRAARVASRRCRPPLAGGATTSGEAGRRPRPGSRARRVDMDRIGLRI